MSSGLKVEALLELSLFLFWNLNRGFKNLSLWFDLVFAIPPNHEPNFPSEPFSTSTDSIYNWTLKIKTYTSLGFNKTIDENSLTGTATVLLKFSQVSPQLCSCWERSWPTSWRFSSGCRGVRLSEPGFDLSRNRGRPRSASCKSSSCRDSNRGSHCSQSVWFSRSLDLWDPSDHSTKSFELWFTLMTDLSVEIF